MPPSSLSEILAPRTPGDFINSCWGKTYLHVPGWPGKFSELLPWTRLNEILEQHRLEPPRLRVVMTGEQVPASSFIKYIQNRRRQAAQIPRLRADALIEKLRQGATLVLDAVDEVQPVIRALAEALERDFHVHVQVNAYAGWRTSHGFDLHWDDHDVLVLQVAGRKRWKVYGMTPSSSLAQGKELSGKPPEEVLWDRILEDGDLLYIPRGWWHVALPLDEPTLHLTVGVHNPTGVDLLTWLVDQLRASTEFGMDLPRFADRKRQAAHMLKLKQQLDSAWTSDLLDRYFRNSDERAEPRQRFSLPWSATPEVLPSSDLARVRITAPRATQLQLAALGQAIEIRANRKQWRFAENARIILDSLKDGGSHSIAELCDIGIPTLNREHVRTLLKDLLVHGLIAIVDDSR